MTVNNIILVKHISKIVILIYLATSCTSLRNSTSQETLFYILNDYIIDYKRLNPDKKIEALIAYIQVVNTEVIRIVISDYPLQVLFRDIRNKKISDSLVTFGWYKNIPINLSMSSDPGNQLITFFKIDSSLINRAQQPPEYYDKYGNKINISFDGLMEYESLLTSNYIFKGKIKTLQTLDGKIINQKFSLNRLKKRELEQ